jgi:hypothetical protein
MLTRRLFLVKSSASLVAFAAAIDPALDALFTGPVAITTRVTGIGMGAIGPFSDFAAAAAKIVQSFKDRKGVSLTTTDGVEYFVDGKQAFKIEAVSEITEPVERVVYDKYVIRSRKGKIGDTTMTLVPPPEYR